MKRILLLDDSPTIQRVVSLSFASTKGYDVKCASNLEAAKKYLAEGSPDVLIAYVRFSGEASPQFFETLKIPFDRILLLAESRENLEPFEKSGFLHFVRKPFHADELKKAILSIIGDDSIQSDQISTHSLNKTPPPPTFRPTTTISMEALDKSFHKNNETVIAPPPPPPPPMIRRAESHIQPLVTRNEVRHTPPPPPSQKMHDYENENTAARFELPPTEAPPTHNSHPPEKASSPALAFSMAQATFADADARNDIKEWILRELPKIARDVVREELQKMLNK